MLSVAPPPAADLGEAVQARLAGFAGFLHANGFAAAGDDSVRVLETAGRVGMLDPQVLRWSLKALLCGRGDEWRRFDALFDAYFLPAEQAGVRAAARHDGRSAGFGTRRARRRRRSAGRRRRQGIFAWR